MDSILFCTSRSNPPCDRLFLTALLIGYTGHDSQKVGELFSELIGEVIRLILITVNKSS